jgi:hypothetical protein
MFSFLVSEFQNTIDNEIGPEEGNAIAEALKINSSIQHLDLECNEFFFENLFFILLCFFSFFFPQTPKLTKKNQFQKNKRE